MLNRVKTIVQAIRDSFSRSAARLGGTAQGRRMQLVRAVERVARELGLDGAGL